MNRAGFNFLQRHGCILVHGSDLYSQSELAILPQMGRDVQVVHLGYRLFIIVDVPLWRVRLLGFFYGGSCLRTGLRRDTK